MLMAAAQTEETPDMAYQRWDKPGRYYVWGGNDGLHIWPPGVEDDTGGLVIVNNVDGRDNAQAIVLGLVELLAAMGIEVRARKGKCEFVKTES